MNVKHMSTVRQATCACRLCQALSRLLMWAANNTQVDVRIGTVLNIMMVCGYGQLLELKLGLSHQQLQLF